MKHLIDLDKLGLKLEDLTEEQRKEIVVSLIDRGEKVSTVARTFRVSRQTVYNWMADERRHTVIELENLKYIDVFAEQLRKLQEYEAICLKRAAQIAQGETIYDAETDTVIKKTGSHRDFTELMRIVKDLRKAQIDLHTSVGTIPKKVERVYDNLAANNAEESPETEFSEMDRDQLEELTLKNLKNQMIL